MEQHHPHKKDIVGGGGGGGDHRGSETAMEVDHGEGSSVKMAAGLSKEGSCSHSQQDSGALLTMGSNLVLRKGSHGKSSEENKVKRSDKPYAGWGLSESEWDRLMLEYGIGGPRTPEQIAMCDALCTIVELPAGTDMKAYAEKKRAVKRRERDDPSTYDDSDPESNPSMDLSCLYWDNQEPTAIPQNRLDRRRRSSLFSGVTAVQVFSVRIKRCDIYKDEDGSFFLYGSIRARDALDFFKRNYLFQCPIDDCKPFKIEETIPLSGPCRGIVSDDFICFEFNLNAVEKKGQDKGKPISKDVFGIDPCMDEFTRGGILTETFRGKYGAVEMKYAVFHDATEAKLQFRIKSVPKDGLHCKLAAYIVTPENVNLSQNHYPEGPPQDYEIVLFDSRKSDPNIAIPSDDDLNVNLLCPVVVVPKHGHVDLQVILYPCDLSPGEEMWCSFYPEDPSFVRAKLEKRFVGRKDEAKFTFKYVTVFAKVTWSNLRW